MLSAEGTGAKVKHLPFPALSGPGGGWRGGYDSDASREDDKENERSQMSGSKGQGSAKKDKDGNANKNKEVDTTRHQEAPQVRDVDEDDEEGYADDEGGGNRPEQPSRVAYIKGQGKKPPRTCNLVHVPTGVIALHSALCA